MGYSTFGCSPVSVRRNAVIASTSLSFNSDPSCETPITATACLRFQTLPEWKYGGVNSMLRKEGDLNLYSSEAVCVTSKRPLSLAGKISAPGFSTTPNEK